MGWDGGVTGSGGVPGDGDGGADGSFVTPGQRCISTQSPRR